MQYNMILYFKIAILHFYFHSIVLIFQFRRVIYVLFFLFSYNEVFFYILHFVFIINLVRNIVYSVNVGFNDFHFICV